MSFGNRKWNTGIPALMLLMIAITAVLTVYVYVTTDPGNPLLASYQTVDFSRGWQEEAPADTVGSGTWSIVNTFSRKLPEDLGRDQMLCVETRQQALQVSIDDQIVYQAGTDPDAWFGRSMASMWNFVSLPEDAGGKTITLTLMKNFRLVSNSLQRVTLGSEGAVILELIWENTGLLVFVAITLLLGLLFMLMGFLLGLKRLDLSKAGFFYLGLFSVLSAIWVLTDSRILQLFTPSVSAVYILSFHIFMLLPVPLLLYLKTACRWTSRAPDVLCLLFLCSFAINGSLHALGILDLLQTVITTHLLMLLTIGWIFAACIQSGLQRKKGLSCEAFPALCILCGFVVLSLLWFYLDRPGDYARFFRWGLLLFILALGAGSLRKGLALLSDSMHARHYKLLAYADGMTALLNRAAFQRDTGRLRETVADHSSIALLVYDLNDLKVTNDTKGHSAGDELIVAFADCLRSVFGGTGQGYRIGGDEFAILIYDRTEEDVEMLSRRLRETCKIEFACGCEWEALTDEVNFDVDRLFRAADRKMYEEKTRNRRG